MSVLSIIGPDPTEPLTRPREAGSDLDAVKSGGWFDSAQASYQTAKDEVPFVQQSRLQEAYLPIVAAVARAQGKSPSFGYMSLEKAAWAMLPGNHDLTDYDAVWQDINALAKAGKLPKGVPVDRGAFEDGVLTRNGQRTIDQIKASQGTFTSRLGGSVVASFNDPVQVGIALATGGASKGLSTGRAILTEGLVNAGAAAVEMPATVAARARLGEQTDVGDMAAELGTAFAFGAVADAGMRGAGAIFRAGAKAIAIPERSSPVAVAKAFAQAVPDELRTPDQAAALHVIDRDSDLTAKNPFAGGGDALDLHTARVDAAQRALVEPGEVAAARAIAHPGARGSAAVETYLAAVKRQESGGNPNARNGQPGQTASGLYGFTNGTWLATYRREFPNSGLDNAAILARKSDAALQERLGRRLTEDNAAFLNRIGAETDPGNLYVAHHLGTGGAEKVLRAAPDTPLAELLSPEVIHANPHMKGMTAGDFISWARKKMDQEPGAPTSIGGGEGLAMAERPAALDAERPEIALPQLKRDLFPDETSWRIAQSRVEAEVLGLPEPRVTLASVWRDARDELMAAQQGEVHGALFHPEVGPIDVKWGGGEAGLAKIVEKHGEVLDSLPDLLAQMGVKSRSENRIILQSLDHKAVVRLDWNGQQQSWLLSAYQVKGETPMPADYRRAGSDGPDASPVLGATYDLALRQAGFKIEGDGPGATWAMAEQRGKSPRPVHGVFDSAGVMRTWAMNRKDAARAADNMGGVDAGLAVRRVDPPELRQDVLPLADAIAERFADPAAAEARAQADSFTHDVQANADAGRFGDVAFDTGALAPERAADALARMDDEDAALAAMRGCL